jgi:hypothetical protein
MYPRKYLARARNYLTGIFHVLDRLLTRSQIQDRFSSRFLSTQILGRKLEADLAILKACNSSSAFSLKTVSERGFGAKNYKLLFTYSLQFRSY